MIDFAGNNGMAVECNQALSYLSIVKMRQLCHFYIGIDLICRFLTLALRSVLLTVSDSIQCSGRLCCYRK